MISKEKIQTEKAIEEESLNNVDTFLKSISTSWSWTHVTEQQYSALEKDFEIVKKYNLRY